MVVGADVKERLAKQRQLLNVRLGLDVASKIGLDFSGIFSNEDLTAPSSSVQDLPMKVEDNQTRVSAVSVYSSSSAQQTSSEVSSPFFFTETHQRSHLYSQRRLPQLERNEQGEKEGAAVFRKAEI